MNVDKFIAFTRVHVLWLIDISIIMFPNPINMIERRYVIVKFECIDFTITLKLLKCRGI